MSDDTTTRRERREQRAERLREWAGKRAAKAASAVRRAHELAHAIPAGQPILADHYSAPRHRAHVGRTQRAASASVEHAAKAHSMESRAASIEREMARSIYSDDDNAAEQLRARIAGLEAERGRIKAFNATARKGAPDESLLDETQRATLASIRRVCPYQLGKDGSFPGYALSNLSGNIKRNRDRLAALEPAT